MSEQPCAIVLDDLIDKVSDLIQCVRPDGSFLYVNRAWCSTLGYRRDEVSRLSVFDVIHPRSKSHCEEIFRRVFLGESIDNLEAEFVTKTGGTVTLQGSVNCRWRHGQPEATRAILRDITERKRAEAARQQNERQSQLLINAALDAIIVMDQDGLITAWNPQAEAIFGWPSADALGRSLADTIIPERLREDHRRGLRRYLAEGEGPLLNRRIEMTALHRDGHEFPVELTIAPLRYGERTIFSGFLRDISERKKVEEALRSSEDRYRSLVETAQDAILLLEDDCICYCNQAGVELLGAQSPEDVLGKPIGPFVHPDEQQTAVARRQTIRETGRPVPPRAFRVQRLDNQQIDVESHAAPCLHQGRPAIQVVFRDIAERLRRESLIREQNNLLELIATGAPLPESLDALVRLIERQAPAMLGSVLLLDEDGIHLRHGACPSLPDEYATAIDGVSIGPCVGSCGTAAYRKEPVFVEDIATDPLWADYKSLALAHGLRACWSTPILDTEGRVLGTFAIYYRQPMLPQPDHLGLIADATHTAAIAIGRHRAESALRDSQHMLRTILDNIPQGVFWKDRESRYLGCNRVVAQAFGFATPEEIIGKDDCHLPGLTRAQAEFFLTKDRQVMNSNAPELGIIEPATLADGTFIWMETSKIPMRDLQGQVVGILGTWQNITDRLQAEETLQRERARYHQLFEHTPIAIWEEDCTALLAWMDQLRQNGITDLRAYLSAHPEEIQHALSLIRVIDVNRAAVIQNAAQSKEHLLREFPSLFDDSSLTASLDELDGLWQGKTSIEYESCRRRLDGRKLDLIIHIEVARQGDRPDWSRVIVTGTDITERKQAEEERRKLEAQIQHAQKLESLGVLAGGIAHDFNNLLTGMLGYASLALTQLPEESPARPMLRQIETEAQRAADLTQQMLAYSGRGKFVIQALRLDTLVQEMTKLLGAVVSKKAVVNLNLEPVSIEGDATQIRQVVMNLITNASDALDGQIGAIGVRTGAVQADAAFLRSPFFAEELPEGAYAFVEVEDSGSGMTSETLARIFDPFFTTKFTGRGLGLAAVLGIVKGHQGTIKVDSAPGRGTVFQVLFPCFTGIAKEGRPADPERSLLRGEGTVLIVDDEPNLRSFARRVLEGSGFQVREAGDGRDGLDLFHRHHNELVAVLLDMTMPRMDGMEALRELRRHDAALPVLVMSGYTELEVSTHFSGLGANGFLQKPFRPNDLIAHMCELLPPAAKTGSL